MQVQCWSSPHLLEKDDKPMECRYEVQVGAAVRVLADPMATREQKEFFRHVLARYKIILAATGATKKLKKMATGEKEV